MDTPLYVLSTAASMVESVDVAKCQTMEETALKHSTSELSSSGKTLTMPGHYQNGQTAGVSDNSGSLHSLSDNRRKCAGTQTSFSSFTATPYGLPEKYVRMEPVGSASWSSSHKTAGTSSPSPPGYYQHHNTIAAGQHRYGYGPVDDVDMDCDMPLNLTKSSSSHQSNNNSNSNTSSSSSSSHSSSLSSHQSPPSSATVDTESAPRLSVIICNRPVRTQGSDYIQSTGSGSRDGRLPGKCDDPEIEEHFRRSLGTKYQSYMGRCASPKNGDTAEPMITNASNVSITGNVDDHFAKSLGETWTQLNAQKQSSLTGTVDDHFAKALGDTWYKIKAKVETESRPSASVVHL